MGARTFGVRRVFGVALGVLLGGCFNTPTPLAPALHGTVGVPNRGVLTDAQELPVAGPGFVRFRAQSSHYFAQPRLVQALQSAAAEVALRFPGGAPLSIGDLSAKTGGRIPGHDSHRSGRDVDLLFFVTTPAGVPTTSPGFVRFEADGLAAVPGSTDYVRFDVDREWWLLRTLLTSRAVDVQFMFVCHELEALLIDHARALGEPSELIWRAETVLLQPSDSLRHDDHVHLRIACAPDEATAGCTGGGPRWEWLSPLPDPHPLGETEWAEIGRDDPLEVKTPDSRVSGAP